MRSVSSDRHSGDKMKLYTLTEHDVIYMVDSFKRVKARKKQLEDSQRGQKKRYMIREALVDEVKYMRPPNMNFCPSGDAGSAKHIKRKARVKRIKQKNAR